jgi:hypothetical protein
MTIRSIKNQYRGINAHLHSYLQNVRGWNNFHNPHITFLNNALRELLLPMGYTTEVEDSVQVRRADEYQQPRADVTIYDLQPTQSAGAATASMSGVVLPLPKVEERDNPIIDNPYRAISIRQREAKTSPVAWVELLSPSNKRVGNDRTAYRNKRNDVLDNGIVFVEIDYLHGSPPTYPTVPDYSAGQAKSHPYRILVLDARPQYDEGFASFSEFDVDALIPEVIIPLSGTDQVTVDFDVPYQKHYFEQKFGLEYVDYAEFPPDFERYNEADQTRIARRMVAVLAAARDGIDLENEPLPVGEITLDEARQQIEALQAG